MPTGILNGNFYELGNFDQCIAIAHQSINDVNSDFYGKYCLSSVMVNVPLTAKMKFNHLVKRIPMQMGLDQNPLIGHRQDTLQRYDFSLFVISLISNIINSAL